MFLPPCEDCAVGDDVLVETYRVLANYYRTNRSSKLWSAWRSGFLCPQKQAQSFGAFGLWCFLIYKGKPPSKNEIAYELNRYLVDAFLPGNENSDGYRQSLKVSRLIDVGGLNAMFLTSQIVFTRRGQMNPYLMLYAGPAPENYKPCRPKCYMDGLAYPLALAVEVQKYQRHCERALPPLHPRAAEVCLAESCEFTI